jgi:hypothetical protein
MWRRGARTWNRQSSRIGSTGFYRSFKKDDYFLGLDSSYLIPQQPSWLDAKLRDSRGEFATSSSFAIGFDVGKSSTEITKCPRWRSAIERDTLPGKEGHMPDKETLERAREEMHHIREGKHGAASAKQAIAIGLSKARRSGVKLAPPKASASTSTKKQAARDSRKGQSGSASHPSRRRSRAVSGALKRERHSAASHASLSRHAKIAARKRSPAARKRSATKAARTRRATRNRQAARTR